MAQYLAIYEISPRILYNSYEVFKKETSVAVGIVSTLARSFGSPSPKVVFADGDVQMVSITISIQAGKQKLLDIYDLFNIIGDYIAYRMGDTNVRVGRSCR